ncbi:MAG: hypothetical protein PHF00_03950 [Elusimicrobia bacterium]|nr:hypothetical protein [Elusimicrobiota bacterium]
MYGEDRRSATGLLVPLAALFVGLSALGIALFQFAGKDKSAAESSGFDLHEAPVPEPAPAAAAAPGSGLDLLDTGGMRLRFGAAAEKRPEPVSSREFADAAKSFEAKIRVLGEAYTRRYPVIGRYGRDWMSRPELKRLNDDYMRDHDWMKFLRGAARSRDFAGHLAKYAAVPEIQSFVREALRQAPDEVLAAAPGLLREEAAVRTLVANTAGALGLPPALVGGVLGGGKVDEKETMSRLLEGTLQDPAMGKGER